MHIDSHLSWFNHTSAIINKGSSKLGLLRRLRPCLPPLVIQTFFMTCILPVLEYGSIAWSGLGKSNSERLERLQRAAARIITGTRVYKHLPWQLLLAWVGLDRLNDRRYVKCGIIGFKLIYRRKGCPSIWRHIMPKYGQALFQSARRRWTLVLSQTQLLFDSRDLRLKFWSLPHFITVFSILNSIPIENLSSITSIPVKFPRELSTDTNHLVFEYFYVHVTISHPSY